MAVYGVAEAKNNFTHLLDRVQEGESITITRHGKPVAELRAAPAKQRPMTREERIAAYDAFVARRSQRPAATISAADLVRQMRDEGY